MAIGETAVERETRRLLEWFRAHAQANEGHIPPFTNAEAIAELREGPLRSEARAHGNIQSRVDFACYRCNLPPLGLTAETPFRKAWAQQERTWAFPLSKMQAAAQTHAWTESDFDQVSAATEKIPLMAADAWLPELDSDADRIRRWAYSFAVVDAEPRPPSSDLPAVRIVWGRDELILALDQYLLHDGRDLGDEHPEIIALSELLNRLGAVLGIRGGAKFRNPNGVAMKIMNFRRFDPVRIQDGGKGLSAGNKLERPIWDEFAHDRPRLAMVVASIKGTIETYRGRTDLVGDDEPDIVEAPEGKILTRLHRSRERSRKLVEQVKARAKKKWSRLSCVGCSFDFSDKYGPESAHIIECHHTKPVSTLAEDGDKTHIDDLVLLCANCHRVVHSRRPWLSIAQLQERIAETASTTSLA